MDSAFLNKQDSKYTQNDKLIPIYLPHIYLNIIEELYKENLYKKETSDNNKENNNDSENNNNDEKIDKEFIVLEKEEEKNNET